MAKICVIGSMNMDLVMYSDRMPIVGETLFCNEFFTFCGGKGANQAVMAARLNAETYILGCIGNDIFGDKLMENLKKNNVDVTYTIRDDTTPTGIACINVINGLNTIIVNKGANYRLKPDIMQRAISLIEDCDMITLVNEIPLETVHEAIKIANQKGKKVLYNPAPATKIPENLFPIIDYLTPNETECETITGICPRTDAETVQAFKWFIDCGAKTVIVTVGSKGVIYNENGKIIRKPVPVVSVEDTTAAGDAFNAAFAVFVAENYNISEAIEYANAAATLVVMKRGAQDSLPYFNDVIKLRDEHYYVFNRSEVIGEYCLNSTAKAI